MHAAPRLTAVPAGPQCRPAADARVRAAAAVLAGSPLQEVASAHDVDPEQVERWVEALERGGAGAVGGVGLDRPVEGPAASSVAVEDFLSVVAHEVRTPLTAARSGLRVLAAPDLDAGLRAQVARTVQQRLSDLQRLTEDLVTAVEVASGRRRPAPERVDLPAVLVRACAEAGVVPPTAPALHVLVDPGHVDTVAATLLSHAARYAAPADTEVRVQQVGDAALLTVRMAGARLDPDTAEAAFEPFGQAARGDGNGLALYVVRALVVAAGGQVGLAGSGPEPEDDASALPEPAATVLWVRLPLHARAHAPLASVHP